MADRMTITPAPAARTAIGWDGKTLQAMLEASEQRFAETGRYCGIERLSLKEEDPIRYEKMWSRLRGAVVGARETALNISASPIVREIGELCFGLYTPEGDSITLSTGIMAHVHTMSEAIKHMVRVGYEDNPGIASGDLFVNNDPQLGDVHNADVQTMAPIFYEGEIVGWAAGVTHEIDVGAPQPVGMPVATTSRFEDGWILSCEKVGSNDQLHQDYERRIRTAVRTPFYWLLDEKCRIAGDHLIRAAVLRLIDEEGLDTYKLFIREVIEDTRQAFIKNLKTMTVPGTYTFPSFIDLPQSINAGQLPPHAAKDFLMHAPLRITIDADAQLTLSLEGASGYGPHSYNCTPAGLQGGLWVGLSQILIYNDKVNDGAYLATKFYAPVGTWANPDNAYCSNTIAWMILIPSFIGMFHSMSTAFTARGFLEEVIAGYPMTDNVCQGGGTDQYGMEKSWIVFEMSSCGTSARYVLDGEDACAALWNPEGDMGDVEGWELLVPMLYLGRRLRPSSAGMGKQRGGLGFESTLMLYGVPHQLVYTLGEGFVHAGCGLFGGYPAPTNFRNCVRNTDMPKRIAAREPYPIRERDTEASELTGNVTGEPRRDKYANSLPESYQEYDIYSSFLTGGHGLGDVIERDPALVIADLNGDLLLPRFAAMAHGVIAEQDDDGRWVLDAAATEQRRRDIRQARLDRSIPVAEWIETQRARVQRMDFIPPVREMYEQSIALSDQWAESFRRFWELPNDWRPAPGPGTAGEAA